MFVIMLTSSILTVIILEVVSPVSLQCVSMVSKSYPKSLEMKSLLVKSSRSLKPLMESGETRKSGEEWRKKKERAGKVK